MEQRLGVLLVERRQQEAAVKLVVILGNSTCTVQPGKWLTFGSSQISNSRLKS
jgi:hypothetical protein